MFCWEAKEYEFKSKIVQWQSQRIKRLSLPPQEAEKFIIRENEYSSQQVLLSDVMKLEVNVRDAGNKLNWRGLSLGKLQLHHHQQDSKMVMATIMSIMFRQEIILSEAPVASSFQLQHWKSLMTPPYMMLAYPYIEEPNLNFFESFYLKNIITKSWWKLHEIYIQQRMSFLPSVNITTSLYCPPSQRKWNLTSNWPVWIHSFITPSSGDKSFRQPLLPIDHLLLILLLNDQSDSVNNTSLSSFLALSLKPDQFVSSIPSQFDFKACNFMHEIQSEIDATILQQDSSNVNWIKSVRITAPYSFTDQFQRKERNSMLYDAEIVDLNDILKDDDDNKFTSLKQTGTIEKVSYGFIMNQISLQLNLLEVTNINSSSQILPLIFTHPFNIVQHLLSIPHHLIYFTQQNEFKVTPLWNNKNLGNKYDILSPPHCRLIPSYLPPTSMLKSYLKFPCVGAGTNIFETESGIYFYYSRLHSNLSNILRENIMSSHAMIMPIVSTSKNSPVKVCFEEEKSGNIKYSHENTQPSTPTPSVPLSPPVQEQVPVPVIMPVSVPPQLPMKCSPIRNSPVPVSVHGEEMKQIWPSHPSLPELSEIKNYLRSVPDMSDMINNYMQLHGENSMVVPSAVGGRLETSQSPLPHLSDEKLCVETKFISSSVSDHVQLNSSPYPQSSTDQLKGLSILISEDLLVQTPIYSTVLYQKYQIHCIDAPLEYPLGFILDEVTGICILDCELFTSRDDLKSYLRKLTTLAFKFNLIWIVIISSSASSTTSSNFTIPHDLFASLCQSFTQFPCTIEIRYCLGHLSFPSMVHDLCQDAANFVSIQKGILLSTFKNRSLLKRLENVIFSAHCEFLQLFPTINFFLAAQILHRWQLKSLSSVELADMRRELPNRAMLSLERFHLLLHLAWH